MKYKLKYILKNVTSEEIAEIKKLIDCGCHDKKVCEECVFENFPCSEILKTRDGGLEKGVTMKIKEDKNKVIFIDRDEDKGE